MIVRHLTASAMGVASQVLGNVAFFVLLARMWSPSDLGYFVYMYSVSSLLVLLVDYGYPQRVLRDAPRYNFRNRVNLVSGTMFKAIASTFVLIFTLLLVAFGEDPVMILIAIGLLVGSFSDYFGSYLRALEKHYTNSKQIFLSNLTLVLPVMIAALNNGKNAFSFFDIAIILICAKLLYLLLSYREVSMLLNIHLRGIKIRKNTLRHEVVAGFSYATDIFIVRAYGVLDTILLKVFAGDFAVGLYQSGQRMMQGFLPFGQVVNNVFLPLISASKGKAFMRLASQLLISCLIVGGAGAAFFLWPAQVFVEIVFGSDYLGIGPYLWQFAVLVFLRFVSAPLAILLTSTGNQAFRVKSNAVSIILMLVLAVFLSPSYGIGGVMFSLILSSCVVIALYLYGIYQSRRAAG